MNRLYLVDFDRSLFDTARFQNDLFHALAAGDQASQAEFEAEIPQFSDPETGFYDLFEHAAAHTGLTRAQIIARLEAGLPEADYTFHDARDWAARRHGGQDAMVILTVGGLDYQNLKFRYAPSLNHLPHEIISANKSLLMDRELSGQRQPPYTVRFVPGRFDQIILVDDLATHLAHIPALPGISGVHLVRTGGKYSHLPAPPGMRTIRNLGELI